MYREDVQGSAGKSIEMKLLAGEKNMYVVNEDRLQGDEDDGDCDDDDDDEGDEEKRRDTNALSSEVQHV